jgi:hypothetical protein
MRCTLHDLPVTMASRFASLDRPLSSPGDLEVMYRRFLAVPDSALDRAVRCHPWRRRDSASSHQPSAQGTLQEG